MSEVGLLSGALSDVGKKPSLFAAEGFIDQLGEAHTTAAGLFIVHGASLDYQTVKHQTVLRSAILNSNMRA